MKETDFWFELVLFAQHYPHEVIKATGELRNAIEQTRKDGETRLVESKDEIIRVEPAKNGDVKLTMFLPVAIYYKAVHPIKVLIYFATKKGNEIKLELKDVVPDRSRETWLSIANKNKKDFVYRGYVDQDTRAVIFADFEIPKEIFKEYHIKRVRKID